MTDINNLLKDGDPLREDAGLSPVDAERMRRVIVSAALDSVSARTPWLRPFAIAAVGAVIVLVGTMTGDRVIEKPLPPPATPDPLATIGGGAAGERRQLQFSTPGGTRIIWIFDQNLRLQESMP